MFDYNYGHSLGLILLSFVLLTPLLLPSRRESDRKRHFAEVVPAFQLSRLI